MIELLVPDLVATHEIQDRQQQYYWSRAADLLFRRAGILSVRRVTEVSSSCTCLVVCRDTAAPETPGGPPRAFEGPLTSESLAKLGLSARTVPTAEVVCESEGSLRMHLPELLVRNPDRTTAPLLLGEEDAKWRNLPFKVQYLEGADWEPVLRGFDPQTGDEGAIAVRRGADLVVGFPFLDLLSRWLSVPPLNARYGGFSRLMRHGLASERLLGMLVQHFVDAGAPPPLTIDRWPSGFNSALTIRHDYDRTAEPAILRKLLQHYETLGIAASVGFLPHNLEHEALALFLAGNHEVQGHVASPSRIALRNDLRLLREAAGRPVVGVTVHGGPKGIGFRGQRHFEWFDDLGLTYCETFGLRDTIPVPVCRVYDGVPDASRLMATPGHVSLDGSTAPDDHRLEALMSLVPRSLAAGNYTVIMNHPDIHHEQLCTLLSALPLEGVWAATTADVIEWHRASRYESTVRYVGSSYEISFGTNLPLTGVVRAGSMRTELDIVTGYQTIAA